MIVLIDNYDSFVYNLYQFLAETGQEVRVARNDRISPEEVLAMAPDGVVISPGPGKPSEAGICIPLIRKLCGKIPLLGVCLGHQAIGEAFGASVVHAGRLMHGKTSVLEDVDSDSLIFRGIRSPIQVARYHSLAVKEETLPDELKVTARSGDGDHGDGAQDISCIWTAVSPGVGDDARGTPDDREFYQMGASPASIGGE